MFSDELPIFPTNSPVSTVFRRLTLTRPIPVDYQIVKNNKVSRPTLLASARMLAASATRRHWNKRNLLRCLGYA